HGTFADAQCHGVDRLASASDTSWQIGLPHLLAGVGAIVLIFSKRRSRWGAAGIALTTLALFMCHSISLPIWNALPLLRYVQFPWRFLGLAVFGAAMCGAALIDQVRTINPQLERSVFFLGLFVVMAAYFPHYSEARFQALDSQTNSLGLATSERVNAMRKSGVLLSLDQIVTPVKMREVGERGTSSDDFLPRGVEEKPTAPASEPITLNQGKVRQWDRPALNHYRASVSMRKAGKVELQQFWFPGWNATLDGRATDTAPSGKAAIVSCDVPIGDHSVEFRYIALPQRQAGLIVSCVSMALAAAALFVFRNGGAL
ncbi:MAG: hypothetical protein M3O82_03410, partial [Verrucomicrobiota bacterium]|nr:hypothetical protein [Verrucomicrobiota bacterium]